MAVLKSIRALLCALLVVAPAPAAAPTEYQVKAAFLFNFSRFVEWPEAAFPDPKAPFVVCVFGFDPFGADLDAIVQGESVRGRPLTVRRVGDARAASGCQILFIHRSEGKRLDELRSALDGHGTLTVSDTDDETRHGVIIRLVTQQGRIRMRIDVDSARAAQLTISSNLLRSAQIVGSASRDGT